MTTHEFVASNTHEANKKIEKKLHQSVSSEGKLPNSKDDLTAKDFAGKAPQGKIEAVDGFDPSRALGEVAKVQIVAISQDLKSLPDAATLAYSQPETVCDADDRARITPANDIPWRWICKLIITFPGGQRVVGTGWFIGARTVMTAAHCLHSRDLGWAQSIEVIPGMDGDRRPYGSQFGVSFRATSGWIEEAKPEYDYGAIILPDDTLGNQVGWFGFVALTDNELQSLAANTSGYPGDKPPGTQWFNAGGITQVEERRIYYMIDTMGGQSGSPVWRKVNDERQAVGIHAYGGCPNSAARITADVFNNMLAWRDNP